MRSSAEIEAQDVLQALAADRRELQLNIETARPLRKPRNALQKRVMSGLHEEAFQQISEQLDRASRRAFRGHVAVEMRLALPKGRHDAQLKPVVKAYLDLLKGAAIFDDAVVDHLLVQRGVSTSQTAQVAIRCWPISVFQANFDRAFRVIDELDLVDPDAHPRASPWGLARFDQDDRDLLHHDQSELDFIEAIDAEVEAAFEDDPDSDFMPDLSSSYAELADPDIRASARLALRECVGFRLGCQLTDQGFDIRDRPGLPPELHPLEIAAVGDADIELIGDGHSGRFILPPLPSRMRAAGEPSWKLRACRAFASRAGAPFHWRQARFGGPIAFDVAARGGAADGKDLDNLAHDVIGAFSRVFAASQPDVAAYRVYRMAADAPDIRVRVLPAIRLELLSSSLDKSRTLVRQERASRVRAW